VVEVPEDRVPLFVRLPRQQAAALDRLVDATGARKQQVVSELLGDRLAVGHIEILEDAGARGEEVLTLDEAAELLRLPSQAVRVRALAGELPGRVFGEEWRFARSALLAWLAGAEVAQQEIPRQETAPAVDDDHG
jgi:excisionase family DNA binding protein